MYVYIYIYIYAYVYTYIHIDLDHGPGALRPLAGLREDEAQIGDKLLVFLFYFLFS